MSGVAEWGTTRQTFATLDEPKRASPSIAQEFNLGEVFDSDDDAPVNQMNLGSNQNNVIRPLPNYSPLL